MIRNSGGKHVALPGKDSVSYKNSQVWAFWPLRPLPHSDGNALNQALERQEGKILTPPRRSPASCLPPIHLQEQFSAVDPGKSQDVGAHRSCQPARRCSPHPVLPLREGEAGLSKLLSQDRKQGKGDMTVMGPGHVFLFPLKLAPEYFKAPLRD